MSNSLRDQLLGLGFTAPAKPERSDKPSGGRPGGGKPGSGAPGGKGRSGGAANRRGGEGKGGHARTGQPAQKHGGPRSGKPASREDIDLAKAYAIRAQREKDERIAAEKAKQEEARIKREARAKLAEFVKDKGLNVADAEIARHFPYGGKIKRIYVTADQLKALNAGELGVVQLEGRYLLVTAEVLAGAEAIFAPAVALKVDPNAPAEADPYSDPQFQVPDDLVW
jgi:uncharacterized protein YaiL (DUF2058 family)